MDVKPEVQRGKVAYAELEHQQVREGLAVWPQALPSYLLFGHSFSYLTALELVGWGQGVMGMC